jgi:hypothetical protein
MISVIDQANHSWAVRLIAEIGLTETEADFILGKASELMGNLVLLNEQQAQLQSQPDSNLDQLYFELESQKFALVNATRDDIAVYLGPRVELFDDLVEDTFIRSGHLEVFAP